MRIFFANIRKNLKRVELRKTIKNGAVRMTFNPTLERTLFDKISRRITPNRSQRETSSCSLSRGRMLGSCENISHEEGSSTNTARHFRFHKNEKWKSFFFSFYQNSFQLFKKLFISFKVRCYGASRLAFVHKLEVYSLITSPLCQLARSMFATLRRAEKTGEEHERLHAKQQNNNLR